MWAVVSASFIVRLIRQIELILQGEYSEEHISARSATHAWTSEPAAHARTSETAAWGLSAIWWDKWVITHSG